ncbi:hypothetical protein ACFYZM_03970 [Streptomyces nondiastaticus]|uniref:Uncharacterized protein n=1 Tax=Streptomyces nondiastaticus TaxID=3154512 RepID=A0ABW6TS49_9ACTN
MGPRALPDRQVAGVEVGGLPAVGDNVADRLRFDVLGTKLEEWCKAKNVGYRFVHDPDRKRIVLNGFIPRDRSKTVRVSLRAFAVPGTGEWEVSAGSRTSSQLNRFSATLTS